MSHLSSIVQPSKPLLIFGFTHTNSTHIVDQLRDIAHIHIIDPKKDLQSLYERCATYERVVGIGDYSGRDTSHLRIETLCTSQFRNTDTEHITLPIPYFLRPEPPFRLAQGIGNSYCNLVSYGIVSRASSRPYTFIHVPTSFDSQAAYEAIRTSLIP